MRLDGPVRRKWGAWRKWPSCQLLRDTTAWKTWWIRQLRKGPNYRKFSRPMRKILDPRAPPLGLPGASNKSTFTRRRKPTELSVALERFRGRGRGRPIYFPSSAPSVTPKLSEPPWAPQGPINKRAAETERNRRQRDSATTAFRDTGQLARHYLRNIAAGEIVGAQGDLAGMGAIPTDLVPPAELSVKQNMETGSRFRESAGRCLDTPCAGTRHSGNHQGRACRSSTGTGYIRSLPIKDRDTGAARNQKRLALNNNPVLPATKLGTG